MDKCREVGGGTAQWASTLQQYQPCCAEGTCSPPPTLHCLYNSKRALGGLKIAHTVRKGVHCQLFGCSCQLLLNKFFGSSTMRKEDEGWGGKWGAKEKTEIMATNVIISRPPELPEWQWIALQCQSALEAARL